MAPSTTPVIQDCALMRLPRELRDFICELAVIEVCTLNVITIEYDCDHQESRQPALARTCRQLLAVHFRANNFAIRVAQYHGHYEFILIGDLQNAYGWLSRMTAEHRGRLGKLIICSDKIDEEYHRNILNQVTGDLQKASSDGMVLWAWRGEKSGEKCILADPDDQYYFKTGHYWLNIIG
ncbi:hypothetical protein LTS10_000653 [Elasticomyces elasticus]|nr:hypothetical protein LTS10_000653 [Elasticomyces elasticus]